MLGRLFGILLGLIGLAALLLVGAYFALKRPDIPYETLAAKYENSASRYAELPGGVRMHYRDEGARERPTLLLIHGFAASLQTWAPWVERLGTDYRLISLDLPGHGLTRAPAGYQAGIEAYVREVAAFAQAQGLTRFAIAGSSMGGHVAWEYALAHPEQVSALVLVDSAGWPADESSQGEGQSPIIFQLLNHPASAALIRDLDNSHLIRQGLLSSFPTRPDLVDDAMVARYSELSRAPGHRDMLLSLMSARPDRPLATPERLAPLASLPTLIMHGRQDNIIPFAHGERFQNAISGSQLAAFEGVGHVPQEELPDESAQAVHQFLQQAASGQALATAAE